MKSDAYQPHGHHPIVRSRSRFNVRQWSVRHSKQLEKIYNLFAGLLLQCHPILKFLGYKRIEKPVVFIEKNIKGFLFDCRMCGRCILSDTGMSCPMNCPKSLRNGPCGGVRANGNCEVEPICLASGWKHGREVSRCKAVPI
nr:methylenetetrahydrofolate reductase C-terminal domain-containing protein [Sneathiella glossodoripedis]